MKKSKIDQSDLLIELENLAEESYKKFNLKIIPTKQHVLGIRIPALRKMAKRIAKEDFEHFIALDKENIYEMVMLEGMVLSYVNKPFKELLTFTETFLDKVDNWAQIDCTVGDYRNIKKDKEDVLEIVKKWLKSDKEFVVRAGLIVLLGNYIEEQYLSTIFQLSQKVTHQGYYVYMGNAWLISTCMAKFPKETIAFFKHNTLDNKTHNQAIQKSRESTRVSKENKKLLKGLKRKKG